MIQIGRYEELGSGVRKVNQYLPHYAPGADKPVFEDGDMFKVTVLLATAGIPETEVPVGENVTPEVMRLLSLSATPTSLSKTGLLTASV